MKQYKQRLEEEIGEAAEFFDCDCCGRNTLYWKNSNLVLMMSASTLYVAAESVKLKNQIKAVISKEYREEISDILDDAVVESNIHIDYDANMKYCALCVDRDCPESTGCNAPALDGPSS